MFKVEGTFGRFVLSILLPGILVWTILLIIALLDPTVVCNIPGAMCCYICGILVLLAVVPGAGSLAFPVLFAPGYLIVRAAAKRIAGWRSFYWIIGWGMAGLIASVLFEVILLIADWKFIALNINNNILSQEVAAFERFGSLFVFFGPSMRNLLLADAAELEDRKSAQGRSVMRYAIVIEKAEGNYSAYVPDLPGCVATGATVAEVESEIREAIRFHIDGLKTDGIAVPAPTSIAEYIEA